MSRIGRGRGRPVVEESTVGPGDSGVGTATYTGSQSSYPRGAATATSSRPIDLAIQDITAAATESQGNAIPKIHYNHKMPKGGDQVSY